MIQVWDTYSLRKTRIDLVGLLHCFSFLIFWTPLCSRVRPCSRGLRLATRVALFFHELNPKRLFERFTLVNLRAFSLYNINCVICVFWFSLRISNYIHREYNIIDKSTSLLLRDLITIIPWFDPIQIMDSYSYHMTKWDSQSIVDGSWARVHPDPLNYNTWKIHPA